MPSRWMDPAPSARGRRRRPRKSTPSSPTIARRTTSRRRSRIRARRARMRAPCSASPSRRIPPGRPNRAGASRFAAPRNGSRFRGTVRRSRRQAVRRSSESAAAKPALLSERVERQVAASFSELSEAFAARSRKTFDEMAEEMIGRCCRTGWTTTCRRWSSAWCARRSSAWRAARSKPPVGSRASAAFGRRFRCDRCFRAWPPAVDLPPAFRFTATDKSGQRTFPCLKRPTTPRPSSRRSPKSGRRPTPSRPAPARKPGAEPFTIVIPPPNVTGSLHMGHALNNTLQDILVRFERMRGKNVLWQPGMDHAGIATQMVVERQLMEKQIHRRDLGRERVRREGLGVEGRVRRHDLQPAEAARRLLRLVARALHHGRGPVEGRLEVFVTLYKQGLIYKDKRLVNWDPKLLTAISDLEVEQRRGQRQSLAFPLSGRGRGLRSGGPDDLSSPSRRRGPRRCWATRRRRASRRRALHGIWSARTSSCRSSAAGSRSSPTNIPIPEKGTGAVKITPAHDFNDFEVGKRHKLPAINILTVEADDQHQRQRGLPRRP